MKLKEFHDYRRQLALEASQEGIEQARPASTYTSSNAPAVRPEPEPKLVAQTEIDVAISKVFEAETSEEKLNRLAVAMQVIANALSSESG